MSPAVAARGKVRRAARRGEAIPLGYALDAQGRPTTDPNAALDGGVMQPIGGPKGSGLSMLISIDRPEPFGPPIGCTAVQARH